MTEKKLHPAAFVRVEADALLQLAERMEGRMRPDVERAIARVLESVKRNGRVIAVGLGKSGHIARKMVATLNSFGVAAQFLHAGEAAHGDIGMVHGGDTVLAFSYSGETEELLRLLETLKTRAAALIAICGCTNSTLAKTADVVLDVSVSQEACQMQLAPTASTTVMLALADALAIELSQRSGLRAEDFAVLHPGGRLGKRLQPIGGLMHAEERAPRVRADAPLAIVIHEMSEKRLGMTTVVDTGNKLLGVISDGDLRRLLEREGGNALQRTAGEIMHRTPCTMKENDLAASALEAMESKKITSLVVIDDKQKVLGVVHLHDLWEK
ncbi:MAG: KpsF/GutQ family sugar-phosphate isomerase [Acidobacteria bacterium]|nr:KpsF/GutQ family sugar-phosphate isomerase [Acidobacteriota bacterium]